MESHTNLRVRTNDEFEVDVECRVDSFVYEEQEDKPAKAIQTPTKLRSDRLSHRSNVMEVQRMVGRMDEEDDGVIINDEAIHSVPTGSLDVGALAAFGSLRTRNNLEPALWKFISPDIEK